MSSLPTPESTERWQESNRRPRQLLVILDRAEDVIDPGYIRHLGPGRDPETELYQVEDPGWPPFTIVGDDILEIAEPTVKPEGLCPICGERVRLQNEPTADGRRVGSCGDAFTTDQWIDP